MEVIVINKKAFEKLLSRIKSLEESYNLTKDQLVQDHLYSSEEVRKILKVGKDSMQRFRDSGNLKFIKIGNSIRYRWPDIQSFLDHHKQA